MVRPPDKSGNYDAEGPSIFPVKIHHHAQAGMHDKSRDYGRRLLFLSHY
jgi:hypothetical protein